MEKLEIVRSRASAIVGYAESVGKGHGATADWCRRLLEYAERLQQAIDESFKNDACISLAEQLEDSRANHISILRNKQPDISKSSDWAAGYDAALDYCIDMLEEKPNAE